MLYLLLLLPILCSAASVKDLPDFRLSMTPLFITDDQAVAAFAEIGPQTVRANATYGINTYECQMIKLSAEYLSQKLGISFKSGRTHRWVSQGAVGGIYRFVIRNDYVEDVDVGMTYSHAKTKSLKLKMIPEVNDFTYRAIAGSDAFGLNAATSMYPWSGGRISGTAFFDVVRYRRHYEKKLTRCGPGIGIAFDQRLFQNWNIHAGVDVRNPFIYYNARLSSAYLCFGTVCAISIFGEKIHGLRDVPSSSRVGINLDLILGCYNPNLQCEKNTMTTLGCFVSTPAVYMPEVLVIKDEKIQMMCEAPRIVSSIPTTPAPPGPFTLDVSSYFTGGTPLIFGATGLPANFTIDPLTGIITGTVNGSQTSSLVTVTATNYCGQVSQSFLIDIPI